MLINISLSFEVLVAVSSNTEVWQWSHLYAWIHLLPQREYSAASL